MQNNQDDVSRNQNIIKMVCKPSTPIGSVTELTCLQSDSAAARTFATPELATMILCHLPPVQMYVVRQVNWTFHDCIARSRYCRQVMLLEPGSAFSLFRLTKLLAAPQFTTAVHPFYISKINKRSAPQPHVLIEVYRDSAWRASGRPIPGGEKLYNELNKLEEAQSWRHIKILSSNSGTKVHLRLHCGCFSHFIEFEDEVTLGEMLLECMKELKTCESARLAEALASQARARRRRGNTGSET